MENRKGEEEEEEDEEEQTWLITALTRLSTAPTYNTCPPE